MTIPIGAVAVPENVTRVAAGRTVTPAGANEIGGLTFRIGEGTGREFVKVAEWSAQYFEAYGIALSEAGE